MSVKTLMATVPGLSYGKGIGMTDGLRIDSVIAAANDLDRWYVPPAFKVPYHSNNNGAAVRICDLQGTYGVAPVGAATGADTYALNRITVGGSVILIATITMTSLKASAATSLVKGGVGVAGECRAAAGVGVGISVSMCLLVRADLKAHSYGNLSLHSGLAEHSSTSRFRVRFQEACGLTGVMRLRRGRRPEAVEETLEVPSTQSLTLPELQFSRGQW